MRLRTSLLRRGARQPARAALSVAALSGAALLAPATLAAQGFGVNAIGSCAVARGFAVTSAPCADASAIYWNPAALAELDRSTVSAGVSSIGVHGGFTQDISQNRYKSNIAPAIVPAVFVSTGLGRLSLGIGAYVPYGLTSQWGGDFPGRFSALKASIKNVYVQPNVAYRVNENWSIGGGPVFAHSDVDLYQALDLSQQVATVQGSTPITFGQLGIASQTQFGVAHLSGSATGFGLNAGVHATYGPWQFGGRFLSAVAFHYDKADVSFQQSATGLVLAQSNPITPGGVSVPLDEVLAAQFAGSGALTPQGGRSRITDPWQAQLGAAYTGFAGTTLSADATLIGWSAFNALPVTFTGGAAAASRSLLENYRDSWSYRFGAEHRVTTGALRGWTGRVGYAFAQTPAPKETVTPLLPDMNSRNVALGVGIPIGSALSVDAAYLHVSTGGRRGRVTERTSLAQTAEQMNSGVYDLAADVLSLSVAAHF